MITLKDAISIANDIHDKEYMGLILYSIREYPDRYVFSYGFELDKYEPLFGDGAIYVMKDTGYTNIFFPPDYDHDFLASGVDLPGYGLDKEAREALERKYLEYLKRICVNPEDIKLN